MVSLCFFGLRQGGFSPLPPRPFTPAGVKGSLNSRFGFGAPVTDFGSRGCGADLGARIGRRCGRSGGLMCRSTITSTSTSTSASASASASNFSSSAPPPDVRPSEQAHTVAPRTRPTPLERAEQRRIGRMRAGACLRRQPSLRQTPPKPSSARYPAGARSTARLFFGYFLLAKQKKVARPPGRNPGNPENPLHPSQPHTKNPAHQRAASTAATSTKAAKNIQQTKQPTC
jgi:hypothetical protein